MLERVHESGEEAIQETPAGAAPEPGAPVRPGPLSALAAADLQTRVRMASTIQRSAGNQSLARALAPAPTPRMLMRDPAVEAPPGPAAAGGAEVDTGLVAMLKAFWPDDAWSGARLTMDLLRIVPALGFVTGLTADVMAAWDDMSAVPTTDPLLFGLTEGLIVFRSGVNIVSNGAAALLELGQIAQWAGTFVTVSEGVSTITVPLVGPVTLPGMLASGLTTLGLLATNEIIGGIVTGTAGGLAAIDFLIVMDAGIWSWLGPVEDHEEWAKLGVGYIANLIGDLATMLVAGAGAASLNTVPSGAIAQAIDTLTAVLKQAHVPLYVIRGIINSFWNVQGGDVLERSPQPQRGADGGLDPRPEPVPGPRPEIGLDGQEPTVAREPVADEAWRAARAVEFTAARDCYERGDAILTTAQGEWAELLDAGASMTGTGAAGAMETLRAQLPVIAGELESRVAFAEEATEKVGGGLEAMEAYHGQLEELMATVGDLSLPLDQIPDDTSGAALRTFLEPVASALETAKTTAIEPMQELYEQSQELLTLLRTVARVAEDTAALYRDALERTVEAMTEADSVSEMVAALAEESAALAASADTVPVAATVEDWRALGGELAEAEAAL